MIQKPDRKSFGQIDIAGRYCRTVMAASCLVGCTIAHAIAQTPSEATSQIHIVGSCTPKSATGELIVEMAIMFSVSNPKQDVTCTYSDGSGIHFQVDKGCDVQPTGVIADGMGPNGAGFTSGRHECRESVPGAGECPIVCPKR
jgi:hypothetical protein